MQKIDFQEIRPILSNHAQETGYSLQMLEWGFEHMLSHWCHDELIAMLRHEIPADMNSDEIDALIRFDTSTERRSRILNGLGISCARRVMMVSASTVPSAAFQDVLASLLLPLSVLWRPASNLYGLSKALHEWLYRIAPELSERLEIMRPEHDTTSLTKAASDCDVLIVNGSNQTIDTYAQIIEALSNQRKPVPKLIRHGHRVSCIALRQGDLSMLSDEDIHGIALDASVWDQTGCLSPKCIFAEEPFEACVQFGHQLMHSLNDIGKKLPATGPDIAERASRNSALNMMRFDGNEVIRGENHDVIVVHHHGLNPLMSGRTLNIFPVEDCMAAAQIFAPCGQAFCSRLSPDTISRKQLEEYGYNYFCRFGEMQDPPLTWFHDNIGTIRPLVQLMKTE